MITPDGCAVELYAQLPAGEEPSIIRGAIRPGASILELGCGAGRVTHQLLAFGHRVVAVDESRQMLARVRGAQTVRSRIEGLALDERFDVVLLASHLVNTPDDDVLASLLACCERHVAVDGCVLIERHPPRWFDEIGPGGSERDGVVVRLRDVSRPATDLVAATVEYRVGPKMWSQTFVTRRLDDRRLDSALCDASLARDAFLTSDGGWVRARPA